MGTVVASRLAFLIYFTYGILPQRKLTCSELEGSLVIWSALIGLWWGDLSLVIQGWS